MRKTIKLNPVVAFQSAASSNSAAPEKHLPAPPKEEKEPETKNRPLVGRAGPRAWY